MRSALLALMLLLVACGTPTVPDAARNTSVSTDPAQGLREPDWSLAEDEGSAEAARIEVGEAGVAFSQRSQQLVLECKIAADCAGQKGANLLTVLDEVARFLAKHFGPPIYAGPVRVKIALDVGVGARMVWKPAARGGREIHLSKLSFIREERKTIAHELFHALYQTDEFMRSYPDVVIEGLAVYAEYLYRYPDLTPARISPVMISQVKALGLKSPLQVGDYNLPFAAKSSSEKDILYIAAGHFFMSQRESTLKKLLAKLLRPTSNTQDVRNWFSLPSFAAQHDLKIEPIVFAEHDSPEVAPNASPRFANPSFCELGQGVEGGDELSSFIREIKDDARYRQWRDKHCASRAIAPTPRAIGTSR